jgi:hypothetical protein
LEWAQDLLAPVIRQIAEHPDARFAGEVLDAALLEERDLATFARHRRNLRQHVSLTSWTRVCAGLKLQADAAHKVALWGL